MKIDIDEVLGWFIVSSGAFICLTAIAGVWELIGGLLTIKLIITSAVLALMALATLALRN